MAFELNEKTLKKMQKSIAKALNNTVEALRSEVVSADVTPFDVGTMEKSMFVEDATPSNLQAKLVVDTSYARKHYYNEQRAKFQTKNNANAKGHWLDDWTDTGEAAQFVVDTFDKKVKENLK